MTSGPLLPLGDLVGKPVSPRRDDRDGFFLSFKGKDSGRVGVLLTRPACPWLPFDS